MKKIILLLIMLLMGCEIPPKIRESEHPLIIIKKLPISYSRFGQGYYYVKTFNGDDVITYEVNEEFYTLHAEKDTIKNYIIE